MRGKHNIGGNLQDDLAKRLAKRFPGATGQRQRLDEVHLGRAQLAKRFGERRDGLSGDDRVNLRLAKRQAKQFARGFGQGSVFVFGDN